MSVFLCLKIKNHLTNPSPPVSRLTSLKEVHRRHELDRQALLDEFRSLQVDAETLTTAGPSLATRFKFYQDMRGYVTDLVECLDEKVLNTNEPLFITCPDLLLHVPTNVMQNQTNNF